MTARDVWIRPDLLEGWQEPSREAQQIFGIRPLAYKVGENGLSFAGQVYTTSENPTDEDMERPICKLPDDLSEHFGYRMTTITKLSARDQRVVTYVLNEEGVLNMKLGRVVPEETEEPESDYLIVPEVFGRGSFGKRCEICDENDYSGEIEHKPGCLAVTNLVRKLRARDTGRGSS